MAPAAKKNQEVDQIRIMLNEIEEYLIDLQNMDQENLKLVYGFLREIIRLLTLMKHPS